jgi:hypothetical protein
MAKVIPLHRRTDCGVLLDAIAPDPAPPPPSTLDCIAYALESVVALAVVYFAAIGAWTTLGASLAKAFAWLAGIA